MMLFYLFFEMDLELKNSIGHRRKAVKQLVDFFQSNVK